MTKIFISNFSSTTSIAGLARLFEDVGDVSAVRIREGRKRRYGVVEMTKDSHAAKAIKKLDGRKLDDGKSLEVLGIEQFIR